MKLLIFTQSVDLNDTTLGFFHGWIEELSNHVEEITVICLWKGNYKLPKNVRIYTLGKETGRSRIKYISRFYKYIWLLRNDYDAVFVHMNQEYILLGGLFWRLFGKRVFLWRNYHKGNILTDIAVMFCTKVFCTSKFSYTAGRKKTVLMPVGVDMETFVKKNYTPAKPQSIISCGRISPSKRLDVLIEALGILAKQNIAYNASIYGNAISKDEDYNAKLHSRTAELNINNKVKFRPGVPNKELSEILQSYEIFVNVSPSGMYDKTIFEAAASGCLVVASSQDWANIADKRLWCDGSAEDLAKKLFLILSLPNKDKLELQKHCMDLAQTHSLKKLARKLAVELSS